ncbi:MAG: PucR family transcriptional regulator ligand-binding domain-containing protein [Microbacteriaceae bacterium]|nr:PucR family transcriptional regulator ligand-binding domain-containing protein [Microbacteriaceae bacterium]
MITLAQLCDHVGPELGLTRPGRIKHTVLTGVHISELTDPTPYLEGGELLLTTGIPLAGDQASVNDYVQRLLDRGVAALGLGLGAGIDRVSPELRTGCELVGLELLIVPAGIPFLNVSRAYWDLVGRAEQSELAVGLKQQTSLARAATRPGAVAAVIRLLAEACAGWAAYLPADDRPETVWPASQRAVLPRLRGETSRLHLAGTYSSATFPLDDTEVVVYSIVVERATVGFLAVGAGHALRRADRQLLLTGCMLLAVSARQERQLAQSKAQQRAAIASLLIQGYPDAARLIVAEFGLAPLPERFSLLVIAGHNLAALSTAELANRVGKLSAQHPPKEIRQRIIGATLRCEVSGLTVVLVEAGRPTDAPLAVPTRSTDAPLAVPDQSDRRSAGSAAQHVATGSSAEQLSAALSEDASLKQLAELWPQLSARCRRAAPGTLIGDTDSAKVEADGWVLALRDHSRGELLATVRSYLRNRGQWEATARELGVHRNSLRNRIAAASELLQLDLDDADVAAHLWLALSAHSAAEPVHPASIDAGWPGGN